MPRIKEWMNKNWREFCLTASVLLVSFISLWFRLSRVPAGYSSAESQIHNNLSAHVYTFSYLAHHVVNLPYNFGLYILQFFDLKSLFAIRSVGAIFGLLTIFIFFFIIRKIFGNLVSILTSLAMLTSLWFLQSSRNATFYILSAFGVSILLGLEHVIRSKKNQSLKTILSVVILLLLIYIPGLIYFVAIGVFLERKRVKANISNLSMLLKISLAVVCILVLAPLVWNIIKDLSIFKTILGIPSVISLNAVLHRFIELPSNLFVYNFSSDYLALGHLPMLSIFSDVGILLGTYWFWQQRRFRQLCVIYSVILVGWIAYSLGGEVSYFMFLPLFYILLAAGIRYLLKLWFVVFPINPVARFVGIAILTLSVATVCWYNLNEYFVAWPNANQTVQSYKTDIYE